MLAQEGPGLEARRKSRPQRQMRRQLGGMDQDRRVRLRHGLEGLGRHARPTRSPPG